MSNNIYTPSSNDEIFSYPHPEIDYDDSDLELIADHTGPNNPFYNVKHTEETKANISKSHLGMKRSEEHKNNMSLSHIERYANMTDKEKNKLSKRNSGKNNPMYGKAPWNKGLKLKKVCTNT